MSNWKEIRREKKILEDGGVITIIEEPQKKEKWIIKNKDLIDVVFKLIGTAAIFVPLLVFFFNYKSEIQKKKNGDLSQLYINIAFDLEAAKNYEPTSEKFISASENILYKYPSQIALYKIDSATLYYDSIIYDFKLYSAGKWFSNQLTYLYSSLSDLHLYYNVSYTINRTITSNKPLDSLTLRRLMLKPDTVYENDRAFNYSIKLNDISSSEMISKIDSVIKLNDKLSSPYGSPGYQLAQNFFDRMDTNIYKKDAVLNDLFVCMDSANSCAANAIDYLPVFKSYILKGEKDSISYNIIKRGEMFVTENNFYKILTKLLTTLRMVELRLDKRRELFSKEVLARINN